LEYTEFPETFWASSYHWFYWRYKSVVDSANQMRSIHKPWNLRLLLTQPINSGDAAMHIQKMFSFNNLNIQHIEI